MADVDFNKVLNMLRVLGYRDDILGEPGMFDTTGDEKQIVERLKATGITDDDLNKARDMAKVDTGSVSGVQTFLKAMGQSETQIDETFKAAGVDIRNTNVDWAKKLPDIYQSVRERVGDSAATYLSVDPTSPQAVSAPVQPGSTQQTIIGLAAPGQPAGAPTGPVTPAPGITPAPLAAGAAGTTGAAGGKSAVGDVTKLPQPLNPADAEALIRQKYGYMGSLLDNPDIHKILYGIADGSIAADQFQNQLMTTDWFKTRNDAQQAWEVLKASKPAEAQAQLKTSVDSIQSFAVSMGFQIDDATANEIATSAMSMGWDEKQAKQAVASHYQYVTGKSAVAGIAQTLKAKAADYLMPMGDDTITQWGQQLINGTSSVDDFTDFARNSAKGQFPGLGAWLDQDPTRTMKQFVDPYAQQASNILEVPADQIDFTQPKYQALFGKLDPKTGDRSVMTGPEWGSYLKQQPEWQYTKNAHDTVSNLTDTLAKTFGMVG